MAVKRIRFLLAALLLLAVEVGIALFVHDAFVRPYLGDVLAVIVIYALVRTFLPEGMPLLPMYVFLFAAGAETLQYFRIVEILGLQNIRFFRVLLGSTFDWADILCYAAGCLLTGVYEIWRIKRRKER